MFALEILETSKLLTTAQKAKRSVKTSFGNSLVRVEKKSYCFIKTEIEIDGAAILFVITMNSLNERFVIFFIVKFKRAYINVERKSG